MKKEVFIMHDFKALCRQAHTLVIFKSLHEVPVFEKLLDTLVCLCYYARCTIVVSWAFLRPFFGDFKVYPVFSKW